jgi:hypothetical protein
MRTIDSNTPLCLLTVGEFLGLQQAVEESKEVTEDYTGDRYVHGLAGIARLLGCSKPTVWKYRQDGWIEPAISQYGRVIICDAPLALELFRQQKNKHLKTEVL